MVLGLKHGDRLDMVQPLAGWMAAAGRELLAEAELIAPVPLHWTRLVRRRYNQSAELGRALARRTGRRFVPDLLTRRRATAPQDGGREARAANQAGAFARDGAAPGGGGRAAGAAGRRRDDLGGDAVGLRRRAARAAAPRGVDVLVLARVAFEDSLGL